MSEDQIQQFFFEWVDMQILTKRFPGLELIYAVPNGGSRHMLEAVKLKRTGTRAGVPDVQLPVARGGFTGLCIEFKKPDGNPTKEQRERIDKMQQEGWCALLCWDWHAAARMVAGYLCMPKIDYLAVVSDE